MHCQKMETHSRKINYQYEKSKRRATEIIGLFKIILTLSKSCPGQVEAWLLQKEYKPLRFVMHKTGIITWNTYKEKASWILRETLLTAIAAMHRNRLLRLSVKHLFSVAWTFWRRGWMHFCQEQFRLSCSCHRAKAWATWCLLISSSPTFQWFHFLEKNFK